MAARRSAEQGGREIDATVESTGHLPGHYDNAEQSCGGIAPDDCCGHCPDCLEALDDERQLYGEDGAF